MQDTPESSWINRDGGGGLPEASLCALITTWLGNHSVHSLVSPSGFRTTHNCSGTVMFVSQRISRQRLQDFRGKCEKKQQQKNDGTLEKKREGRHWFVGVVDGSNKQWFWTFLMEFNAALMLVNSVYATLNCCLKLESQRVWTETLGRHSARLCCVFSPTF